MNVATLLSFGAMLLQLGFSGLFLAISRAHGWSRARLFAVLALSAAVYAGIDVTFTVPSFDEAERNLFLRVNYLALGVHCAGWLIYAFGAPEHPWRGLPRVHQGLVAVTLGVGLIAQVPGVMDAGGVQVVELPTFGCTYYAPGLTWCADAYATWLLLLLGLAFARFVRNHRRGEPGARLQLVGFSVFFACAALEMLVAADVLEFIYPGDLGFLAIVLVVLTETVRRVLADARTLHALGEDLAAQVETRTRERDLARDALAHAERLAAVGQLAAGVGHEINNPLAVAQGNLELLHDALRSGGAVRPDPALAADALESLHRIGRVVADLRSYALPAGERREVVELTRVIRAAVKLTSHHLRHVAAITEDLGDLAPVLVDPVRLSQVFVNLLANAGQALEGAQRTAPTITIRGRMIGPDRAAIEIIDTGVGIGPEALARLSEPYFSTRQDRGGTGLGLYVARNILTSVGGTLAFASALGQGTTARVTLPTVAIATASREPPVPTRSVPMPILEPSAAVPASESPAPPAAAAAPPDASAPATSRRRAMVIDDEPMVGRIVARQLATFDVTLCASAAEALATLAHDGGFDVVICDLMMPAMSGVELHAALAATRPDYLARMLFVSGGAVTAEAEDFLGRTDIHYVMKPFTRAELAEAIAQVVDRDADHIRQSA